MKLTLKISLLLIILSVLLYSCEKEYSLEGKLVGGTAVFSLTGAPTACINPVVGGTYTAGTALGASNIVTIAVDVSTAGTYTISTTVVNGISFTGSGSFTTTGPQTISLTGSGTPISAGTFSFTPGTNGCSFPIIISSGGGSSGGTAVFTLNGATGNCTGVTTAGTYSAGTVLGTGNTATVGVTVSTIGTYTISTNSVNGISFTATGTFAATGTQFVQLSGTGTPLVAGLFTYTAGTNGCTFSITVTGGSSNTAVFSYGGAPTSCTSATPSGTYTAGTVLTALNTVIVSVNVTTIGTYAITTPLVNGFMFTGAGSFAAIGAQTVTLTGTGTPTAAGVFNFIPSNNGCSFPITVVAAPVVTDFLTCTIDGVARTFNLDLLGEKTSIDTFDIAGFETLATTSPVFAIRLTKAPAIAAGVYNRFSQTTPSTTFSLGIYSDDATSSTGWVSALLLQTGAFSVNVTSYTTNPNRIQGTFSGTLYDNNGQGSGTKVITLGQFSIPYL